MADPNKPVQRNTDQARAGATPGMTRYILGAGMVLIIIAFLVVFYAV